MKLKDTFITHKNEDEQIVIDATGAFAGMIRNNETAAFIVECLKKETTKDAIVDTMYEQYNAPKEEIEKDVDVVIQKLQSVGAIDE